MEQFFQAILSAGQSGLALLGRAVLPVLFPFFVLTSLIINFIPTKQLWVTILVSHLSGYPNGTRLAKTLHEQQRITTATAQHLTVLTSTPSPMFVIATVGTLFLGSTTCGVLIFICAVGGALLNGLLWRPTKHQHTQPIQPISPPTNFLSAFSQALSSSTSAILNVCGVVFFFYFIAQILHLPAFLSGLLEMTTGTTATSNLILIEFFVSFGGLSVAMQNMLFIGNFNLRFGHYLAFKFTHAIFACALLAICQFLFF